MIKLTPNEKKLMTDIRTLSWSYCNLMKDIIYLLNSKFWEVLICKYSFDIIPCFRKIFLYYVIRLWLQALSDPPKKNLLRRLCFHLGVLSVESKKNGSWHDIKIHDHHHKGWLMVLKWWIPLNQFYLKAHLKGWGLRDQSSKRQATRVWWNPWGKKKE